jgi:hypothetical protein
MSELTIRPPDSIYQIQGEIENGTFHGRWHFSFDEYDDPEYMRSELSGRSIPTVR